MHRSSALSFFVALSLAAQGPLFATQEIEEPAPPPAEPEASAPELPNIAITPPRAEYRDLDATLLLLAKWAEARPEAASLVELGTSAGGRPLRALLIAGPGPIPAAERKTLAIIGGLDGLSLHGAEEVLGIAAGLAANPDQLPAELAFLCLPWASPDGLAAEYARLTGAGPGSLGRDETDLDEDLDGQSGEDAPDDLDGDGRIAMMLVEDPAGVWRRAPDARFLVPHDGGLGQRYSLWREGEDDDHDGRFNEDGPGGVRVDRNFPYAWRGPYAAESPGPLPLMTGSSRALADLARSGTLAGALFFDGHSGRAQVSAGLRTESLAKLASELFAGVLGDVGTNGSEGSLELLERAPEGAAVDWFPKLGVPSVRLSFWGPEIGLGRGTVKAAGFRPDEVVPPIDMLEDFGSPTCASATGGAWRRYLDERRGGIGFVDWHPVELDGGTRALIGGWEAAVLNNPPEEQLARSVTMAMDLVGGLIASLPELRLEVTEVRREGQLCTLVARLSSKTRGTATLPMDFLAPGGLELVH